MSLAARRLAFLVGGAALFARLLAGMRGLPPVGSYSGVYGETLNRVAVAERHATDVVSAVNFDYRAVDTLGEEFILFASVVGVAALLRRQPDEREEPSGEERDRAEQRGAPPSSDAIRTLAVGLVPVTIAFGAYVCSHGAPTPRARSALRSVMPPALCFRCAPCMPGASATTSRGSSSASPYWA